MSRQITIAHFNNHALLASAVNILTTLEDVNISIVDLNNYDDNSAYSTIKRGGATLILCNEFHNDFLLKATDALSLHTKVSCLKNGKDNTWIVSGIDSDISNDKDYSFNKTFGRECSDTIKISEIEIERIARIAYDIATQQRTNLQLLDRADILETSRLYRKIVTDINEDYPYIQVSTSSIQTALTKPLNLANDVLLTPYVFADVIEGVLSANYAHSHTLLLGDMNVGMYLVNEEEYLLNAITDMMKLSFDVDIDNN